MAKLDYAFLAGSAHLEPAGMISALAMSYTHVLVTSFPFVHQMAVGGRAWLAPQEDEASLELTVQAPNSALNMTLERNIRVLPGERPLMGVRSVSFVIQVVVPITQEGTYELQLKLDEDVKTLAFEAVAAGKES